MLKLLLNALLISLALSFSAVAWAEAPVMDANATDGPQVYAGNDNNTDASSMPDSDQGTVDSDSNVGDSTSTQNLPPQSVGQAQPQRQGRVVVQGAPQMSDNSQQDFQQAPDTQSASQTVSQTVSQSTAGLTTAQRLSRLEQQIANLQQMKMNGQVTQLQQQVQDLQGRLDVVTHQLQTAQAQQKDFYQDLDQRITKLGSGHGSRPAKTYISSDSIGQDTSSTTTATNDSSAMGPIGQEDDQKKEQHVYENAYNHIQKKEYAQAIDAMQSYLATYPDGKYAVNAYYWLGELYLLSGDSDNARKQFSTLISKYPQQPKAADALLKLGYLSYDSNNWQQARDYFGRVNKQFPNTASSRLANQRLAQMDKEGH